MVLLSNLYIILPEVLDFLMRNLFASNIKLMATNYSKKLQTFKTENRNPACFTFQWAPWRLRAW